MHYDLHADNVMMRPIKTGHIVLTPLQHNILCKDMNYCPMIIDYGYSSLEFENYFLGNHNELRNDGENTVLETGHVKSKYFYPLYDIYRYITELCIKLIGIKLSSAKEKILSDCYYRIFKVTFSNYSKLIRSSLLKSIVQNGDYSLLKSTLKKIKSDTDGQKFQTIMTFIKLEDSEFLKQMDMNQFIVKVAKEFKLI